MDFQKTKNKILTESMRELAEFLNYVHGNIRFEKGGNQYELRELFPAGGCIELVKPNKKVPTDPNYLTEIKYDAPVLMKSNCKFTDEEMILDEANINDRVYKFLLYIFEKEEERNINDFGIGCRFKSLKNTSESIRKKHFKEKDLPRFKKLTKREIYLVAMISILLRYIVTQDFEAILVRDSYQIDSTEFFLPKRVHYEPKKKADQIFSYKRYSFQLSDETNVINYIQYEITMSKEEFPWIKGGTIRFDDFFNLKHLNTLHLILLLLLSYLFENGTNKVKFCKIPNCGKLFVERRQGRGKFCSDQCRKKYHQHNKSDIEIEKNKCRLRQRNYITAKYNKSIEGKGTPAYIMKDDCIKCLDFNAKSGKCYILKSLNWNYFYYQSDEEIKKEKCRQRQQLFILENYNKSNASKILQHAKKEDCVNCNDFNVAGGDCRTIKK